MKSACKSCTKEHEHVADSIWPLKTNYVQMKKKIIGGIAILAIAVVAAWNIQLNMNEYRISFDSIESLSACETSSNSTNNGGYCVSNYNGSGDSCVTQSATDAVRCSGNI